MSWLSEIAQHHQDWINIIKSYGEHQYCEDIVQEMYIVVYKYGSEKKAIKDGKVSKPYIYTALINLLYKYYNKKNKVQKVELAEIPERDSVYDRGIDDFSEILREELKKHHWYYESIYLHYTGVDNPSMRKLSKDTGISVRTIFDDIGRVKTIAKGLEKQYNLLTKNTG